MSGQDRIEKQIEIAAPLERVWRALTDYRQFGEWFGMNLEGPFVPGEKVFGQSTYPGYEHLRMEMEVQTIEPQTYFSYTWHPYAIDQKVDYSQETPTLVEFRLTALERGVLLTVTESGFSNLPAGRWPDAFRANSRGWEQQMARIDAYVGKSA